MPRFSSYFAASGVVLGLLGSPFRAQAQVPSRFTSGVMPKSTRVFRSLGLLKSSASLERVRLLPPRAPLASASTAIRTAQAGTALSFSFDSGFSKDQIAVLNGFVRANYARMTAIFGDPAPEQSGKTIFVVRSDGDAAYQPLRAPNPTDGGTIYFSYDDGAANKVNTFNFTRLILRAFQGPNTPSYNFAQGNYVEAYQGGLADAAALLVAYGAAGSPADFDPSSLGPYILPVYDLFNRPELANAYIYPRDGSDLVMSDFRAVMAQAACLKVAVENPQFFARFNAAYYAQVAPRAAAAPGQLAQIAAGVVPTVEGQGFNDWVRRQHVLDLSVSTGQKLYAAVLPQPVTRTGFSGFVEAFTTDSSGSETASSGFGRVDAFDENGQNINASSPELSGQATDATKAIQLPGLDFSDSSVPGQADFNAGFSAFGSPDRARVTLKFRFKNAETTAIYPHLGSSGSATSLTLYGVVTRGDSGALSISSNVATSETATVARGAWTGTTPYVSGPRVVTTLKLGSSSFVRNTAWLFATSSTGPVTRGVAFVLDGAAADAAYTLKTASGASQIRMVSVPVFPTQTDEAKVLGVDAASLKLARYRSNLSPGTTQNGVLSFGIGGDRHELYPRISSPIAPGRGYWLGVGDFQATVRGVEPNRNQPFEVPLLGGWNQIGVPFNRAFAPGAIRVRYGGFSAVSLAQAQTNGWISPGIWGWQARGGYVRVDSDSTSRLEPGQGYYVFAGPNRGVALVFDANASSAPALTASALANAGWSVALSASTDASRDSSNRFGTSAQLAAPKPPAAAAVVTLHFHSSGSPARDASGAGAASGWADSFLASLERSGRWTFAVEGAGKAQRTTLAWGDLARVPADVRLMLTDLKSGRRQILAAGGSYKWTSEGTAEGTARQFSIEATRAAQASLGVAVAPSHGVTLSLALNIKAQGRLEIRDGGGNVVAVLRAGEFAASTEKFLWNGVRGDGQMARSGRYSAVWVPALTDDKGASAGFSLR